MASENVKKNSLVLYMSGGFLSVFAWVSRENRKEIISIFVNIRILFFLQIVARGSTKAYQTSARNQSQEENGKRLSWTWVRLVVG